MSETKIYLELPDELDQVMADNGISLEDVFHQENIDVDVTYAQIPYQSKTGVKTKDLVPVILASSVAIGAVSFAISNLINIFHRKPHFIEFKELVELKDGDGNIFLDENGEPRFKTIIRHRIVEPRAQNIKRIVDVIATLKNGIVIKFGSETIEKE